MGNESRTGARVIPAPPSRAYVQIGVRHSVTPDLCFGLLAAPGRGDDVPTSAEVQRSERDKLETTNLGLGLRTPELIGCHFGLFGRLEHGTEPARHLRQAQDGFRRDIAVVGQD